MSRLPIIPFSRLTASLALAAPYKAVEEGRADAIIAFFAFNNLTGIIRRFLERLAVFYQMKKGGSYQIHEKSSPHRCGPLAGPGRNPALP